jgi:hypothetical protein
MTPSQLEIIKNALLNLETREAMNDLSTEEFFSAIKDAAMWRLRWAPKDEEPS